MNFNTEDTEDKQETEDTEETVDTLEAQPALFRDRKYPMDKCPHVVPVMENGKMRCPDCGEIAEICWREDGTSYLAYP